MLSMSKTAAQFLEQPAAMKLPLGLNLIRFTALPAAQLPCTMEYTDQNVASQPMPT